MTLAEHIYVQTGRADTHVASVAHRSLSIGSPSTMVNALAFSAAALVWAQFASWQSSSKFCSSGGFATAHAVLAAGQPLASICMVHCLQRHFV